MGLATSKQQCRVARSGLCLTRGAQCAHDVPHPGSAKRMGLRREALEAQIAERAAQRQRAQRAQLQEPPPAWLAPASGGILVGPGPGPALTQTSTHGPLVSSISVAAQPASHHTGGRDVRGGSDARGTEQGLGQAHTLAQGLRLLPLAPWQLERLAAQAGGAGTVAGAGGPTAPADTPAQDHSSGMWPPERSLACGRRHDAAQASTAAAAASVDRLSREGPHVAGWMGGSNPAPMDNPGGAAPDSPQRMGRRPAAAAASKPTPALDFTEAWADDPYRAGRLGRGRGQFSPERRSVAAEAPAGDAPQPAQAWMIGPEAVPGIGGAAQHATGRKAVPVRGKQLCKGMIAQRAFICSACSWHSSYHASSGRSIIAKRLGAAGRCCFACRHAWPSECLQAS